jgi:acyl carrier protein phosphodiesterase
MNFLAHLYLSGKNEKVMVGNFIGDYVKGRKYEAFENEIKTGILLHRQIDTFTDKHPKFREAKKLFRPELGLYSGIIIDLVYDHFLAKNWSSFSDTTLRDFTKWVHAVLLSNYLHLPRKVQGFLPFIIQNRRLESYATIDGIQKAIEIMGRHSSLPQKSAEAIEIMTLNYTLLENNFFDFMADIKKEFNREDSNPRF